MPNGRGHITVIRWDRTHIQLDPANRAINYMDVHNALEDGGYEPLGYLPYLKSENRGNPAGKPGWDSYAMVVAYARSEAKKMGSWLKGEWAECLAQYECEELSSSVSVSGPTRLGSFAGLNLIEALEIAEAYEKTANPGNAAALTEARKKIIQAYSDNLSEMLD